MTIVLKGCKPDNVSREQVRAFLHASVVVMSYHNRAPQTSPLVVLVRRKLDRPTWIGCYHPGDGMIELLASNTLEEMLTACLHEVIHACVWFPDGTLEKCTSTLTARLKPDVAKLAQILLGGRYQRAAYLAHTKIAYPAKGEDFYDDDQHKKVGLKAHGKNGKVR